MDNNAQIIDCSEGMVSFKSYHQDIVDSSMTVFYNPRMRENRDISIMMISYLMSIKKKKLRLAFPMSATGIRESRLLVERHNNIIEHNNNHGIEILVNDISHESLELSRNNININNNTNVNVSFHRSDARVFLLSNKHYDYIEIDPYGSPVPFIDAALQSLKDNSIIGVTATDTSALCGTYPNATKRKYDATILLSPIMHEVSVRVLSSKIIRHAASLGLGAKMLFSYRNEHYIKLFFSIMKGKGRADMSLSNIGNIMICPNCGYMSNKDKCLFCNDKKTLIGPLYTGPLWDNNILEYANFFCDNMVFSTRLNKDYATILSESGLIGLNNVRTDIHRVSSRMRLNSVPGMDWLKERIVSCKEDFSRSIYGDTIIRTSMKPVILYNILDERSKK
ncbi:MAG: hypothetical protein ACMXYL_02635 [Candidatus Woesearchaeota archaeon]